MLEDTVYIRVARRVRAPDLTKVWVCTVSMSKAQQYVTVVSKQYYDL